MAKIHRDNFYDYRSDEGDDENGYYERHNKNQRARNSRRSLERRLELKALNDMLGDREEYDLD